MRRPPPLRAPPCAAALLVLAACASEPRLEEEGVRSLVNHGRHAEALVLAERRAREAPDDEEAQADYKLASVAALLESCRRSCFADRDEQALAFVEQALEIAPDDPVVQSWHRKMMAKLADRARAQAIEAHAADNLELARQKFEEALRYAPDDLRAKDGIAQVLLQINHRAGMGEAYYREGAQALSTYFLHEARTLFSYTIKYQPGNERASHRKGEASSMLAEDRAAIAADLESRGLYAAAENEYRIALLIEPSLEAAVAGRERAGREARAQALLEEAARLTLRGRFADARALLQANRDASETLAERFDLALAEVEDAELEALYRTGLDYQADGRFPEARDAYARLLERSQYYKDAITRKEVVEGFIQRADEKYAQALAAQTPEEQIQLLREIQVFWPDYKDVRERLKALGAARP